jgi:glycosyltransferase involved in cell wall biosynthesis
MEAFVEEYGGSFTVIRQKVSPNAPFDFTSTDSIRLHDFESFSKKEIITFCKELDPDLIYTAGWAEPAYLEVARHFHPTGIPILCGLDNQWKNTLRQRLGFLYLRNMLSKRFSHIWISGLYQFETARKLGFPKERILTGMYSADVERFSEVIKQDREKAFPRSFLFVGRLVAHKGLMELARAFERLKSEVNTDWGLTIVGNGPLKKELSSFKSINMIDFVQPENLPQLMGEHGVFALPSITEPWGVVIHEAAAGGLPIIATRQCGAATAFVKNGYNGYLAKAGSTDSLYKAMKQIIKKSDSELYTMANRSAQLSYHYTPGTWSSTLHQLIQHYEAH